jgi:hypothetical protein
MIPANAFRHFCSSIVEIFAGTRKGFCGICCGRFPDTRTFLERYDLRWWGRRRHAVVVFVPLERS